MQQYFTDSELNINTDYPLDSDILYHLKKVLRSKDGEIFRICDSKHIIYECSLLNNSAHVLKKLDENNELDISITAIVSLIKSDKFELILQKLTELGVTRIVPFCSERSIIKVKDNDKKLERYKKILKEAAEQSHRNIIPKIVKPIKINDINKYMSELNLFAYEKDTNIDSSFKAKSITYVIGPEGGFTINEVNKFNELGFKTISLGKRILRAETAAIYLTSIIVGNNQ